MKVVGHQSESTADGSIAMSSKAKGVAPTSVKDVTVRETASGAPTIETASGDFSSKWAWPPTLVDNYSNLPTLKSLKITGFEFKVEPDKQATVRENIFALFFDCIDDYRGADAILQNSAPDVSFFHVFLLSNHRCTDFIFPIWGLSNLGFVLEIHLEALFTWHLTGESVI